MLLGSTLLYIRLYDQIPEKKCGRFNIPRLSKLRHGDRMLSRVQSRGG